MSTVVIFVDSKSRDLMGDALIAHHLEKRGIDCHLEPLAAWRACLGAWNPDFLLFNHLNALHLAEFSQRCKEWGVLTGVLPNEGIFYVSGTMEYNSRRMVDDVHCDVMFSWSELHRNVLVENKFCAHPEQVIPVGPPRFDFYKEPWKRLFEKRIADTERPIILVNANFPLAHFMDLQPEAVDRFFAPWKDISPAYADYWNAVRGNREARGEFLRYLEALLAADKYHVVVRPHPRENPAFYEDWQAALPPEWKRHMRIAAKENITELILNSDLELSCENCTTTLEAWIAGKPTVGLTFQKHPFFYTPEVGRLLPECNDPADIVSMVDAALAAPSQEEYAEGRRLHMEKWTYQIDGRAAERVADAIAKTIAARERPKKINLGLSDRRRGWKLRLCRAIGEPLNTTPSFLFQRRSGLQGRKINPRYLTYLKAILPKEEKHARELIRSLDP